MVLSLIYGLYKNANSALLVSVLVVTGCESGNAQLEPTLSSAMSGSQDVNQPASAKTSEPASDNTLSSTEADTLINTDTTNRNNLDIERFIKITTQWEFSSGPKLLYKYPDGATISYSVNGIPTAADLQQTTLVFEELSALTQLTFIKVNNADESHMDIYFEPVDRFPSLLSNYVPGNYGFFTTLTRGTTIIGATILVNTQSSETARHHLIREEVTQSLGLFYDLPDDSTSIFYSEWNLAQQYNDSDKDIIASLYTSGLTAGMSAVQIRQFFD